MDARKTTRSIGSAKSSGAPSRGRQTPSLHPPSDGGKEQWAVDPSDVRRHARLVRERERVGPLGKLVRYTVVVLLLAGAGAAYWNFETLRGMSVNFTGLADLFARSVNETVAKFDGEATQTEVVKETEVVGTAAPSSLSPPAAEPIVAAVTTQAEIKSAPAIASTETSAPKAAPPPAVREPPPGPEEFSFGLAKIEVSEGAPSADILIVRSGDMRRASSITWWTTDGTATAGEDYANLGRVVVKFAPSEQNRGIHVPIIGDRKVEGPETFYVNLAPGSSPTPEPTERLEVTIKDDD
ncbi:MAG: Calx-beta domain-containing protein [Gammaproteobacteria bacterium]